MPPRLKHVRRLRTARPARTRTPPDRRYPPASGGSTAGRRERASRRGLQEKQKIRFHYGISETELRQLFAETAAQPTSRAETRLARLERRLDNVVFRLGWAASVPAARQLVGHGHVRVNGWRLNRPGYLVKVGDELTLGPQARRMPGVVDAVEHGPGLPLPRYLTRAARAFTGRVVGRPTRGDLPFVVDETGIAALYAA